MNRLVRRGLATVAIVMIAGWFVIPSTSSITAQELTTTVSGQLLPLILNEPITYEPAVGTTISGDAYPVNLTCPGAVGFQGNLPSCGPTTIDGIRGMAVAHERFTREFANPAKPTFTAQTMQAFAGSVYLNGQRHFGTMIMHLKVTGELNTPAGVDCFATPENPGCGAKNFAATWTIDPNEGAGELAGLSGSGTLTWPGCVDPNNPATCPPAEYTGELTIPPQASAAKTSNVTVLTPALPAQTDVTQVAGQSLQLFANEPPVFVPNGTNVHGDSYPVIINCPGDIVFANGLPGCGPTTVDGLRGAAVAHENVTRRYADPANPNFTASTVQAFAGAVYVKGKRYFGTMLLDLSITGQLNSPSGVDCLATPENPGCGAKNFNGTFVIDPTQSKAGLVPLRMPGQLAWLGCADPNNPLTCAIPTYSGSISFLYQTRLPLVVRAP